VHSCILCKSLGSLACSHACRCCILCAYVRLCYTVLWCGSLACLDSELIPKPQALDTWHYWMDMGFTTREHRELISGPSLATRVKFLSFNRTQSRVVTGLLTGHNTLRRHLYLLGLLDSPLCRGCGVKKETLAHILCECEALASLRHMYLYSFFWNRRTLRV
jgi:hypothetical protein